jgi:hypothetical protein
MMESRFCAWESWNKIRSYCSLVMSLLYSGLPAEWRRFPPGDSTVQCSIQRPSASCQLPAGEALDPAGWTHQGMTHLIYSVLCCSLNWSFHTHIYILIYSSVLPEPLYCFHVHTTASSGHLFLCLFIQVYWNNFPCSHLYFHLLNKYLVF